MKYISMDIKTSGPNPERHNLLEVGLVVSDTEGEFSLSKTNHLRLVVLHNEIVGDSYFLNMNLSLLSEASKVRDINKSDCFRHFVMWDKYKGIPIETLYFKSDFDISNILTDFVLKNDFQLRDKINIAGKDFGTFDYRFLSKYKGFEKFFSFCSHKVLDVGSLYLNFDDQELPSLSKCLHRAGIKEEKIKMSIDNAIDIIKCIEYRVF